LVSECTNPTLKASGSREWHF